MPPTPFRRRLPGILVVGCALGAAGAAACAPAMRERLARFFFEIPSSQPAERDQSPSAVAAAVLPSAAGSHGFTSIHEPFARRRCHDCHDPARGNALRLRLADQCATCHGDMFRPRPVLHGPFAAGACSECHLPHASALPFLLRRRGTDLCLTCHEPTFTADDAPHHTDAARACADCHDPHGGDDTRLLRPHDLWREFAPGYDPASRARRGGVRP